MIEEDKIRYARMISIPEIGIEGIRKLKKAKVLVIGAGALGSICSMYLAGAGVGSLTVADFDTIDISNLPRQLFYATAEAGKSKSHTLVQRIKALNPNCNAKPLNILISKENAEKLLIGYDFVVDATDNPGSKFSTDRVCQELGLHYCIGGVTGFKGQIMSSGPGYVAYSDIFSSEGVCSGITPCSISGVLGPTAGVIACLQAAETIKHITGTGDMLFNKLFSIDLNTMQSQLLEI